MNSDQIFRIVFSDTQKYIKWNNYIAKWRRCQIFQTGKLLLNLSNAHYKYLLINKIVNFLLQIAIMTLSNGN